METSIGPSRVNKGFLLSLIMVVGLGVLNFGYAIGVFNSMQTSFLIVFGYALEEKSVRDFWTTAMTTVASVGMAVGALGAGPFTKYGKKTCIHVNNIIVVLGCTLCLFKNIGVVLTGRFFYGVSGGAFSVFVPSFINEITPVELKGQFGSSTQILITVGIMISNLLGIPLPAGNELYTAPEGFIRDQYWRVLFAIPILFSIVQSALLFTSFNFETPKFLKQNGRDAELNEIMGKIYSYD